MNDLINRYRLCSMSFTTYPRMSVCQVVLPDRLPAVKSAELFAHLKEVGFIEVYPTLAIVRNEVLIQDYIAWQSTLGVTFPRSKAKAAGNFLRDALWQICRVATVPVYRNSSSKVF